MTTSDDSSVEESDLLISNVVFDTKQNTQQLKNAVFYSKSKDLRISFYIYSNKVRLKGLSLGILNTPDC